MRNKIKPETFIYGIALFSFLAMALTEYVVISTYVPPPTMLDRIKSLSNSLNGVLPTIGATLFLGALWLWFCRKYFNDDLGLNENISNLPTVENQIAQATINLAKASQGTKADQMFFMGLIAALIGVGFYAGFVFTGLSPVKIFIN